MLNIALFIAAAMLVAAVSLNLWRLIRGSDAIDHILALDTLYINALALLGLYGLYLEDVRYFEAALLIALLGFVGTVSLAKYLLRGDIIE